MIENVTAAGRSSLPTIVKPIVEYFRESLPGPDNSTGSLMKSHRFITDRPAFFKHEPHSMFLGIWPVLFMMKVYNTFKRHISTIMINIVWRQVLELQEPSIIELPM